MKRKMRALVLHEVGDLRYEEVDITEIEDGEALVKVRACGVCGSDVPRVMEKGTYSFPLIPGHELSGQISAIKGRTNFRPQDRVGVYPLIPCRKCSYCQIGKYNLCDNYLYLGSRIDGGFAEYVRVPLSNLIVIPEEVDFEEAALVEPASVALHGLRRTGIDVGDKVIIFGAGPVGLFLAQWCRIMGAHPVVVDILEEKLKVAKSLNIPSIINSDKDKLGERVENETQGEGADVAVEAAGVPQTLIECINVTRKGGKILLLGNMRGSATLTEKFISQILRKELNLYGTWNSDFTDLPKNEWKTTLDKLKEKKIRCKPFISHKFSLSEGPQVFQRLTKRKETFHKVLFIPE